MCKIQIQSKFEHYSKAVMALCALASKHHYRNWSDRTVCREAVPALRLFVLSWAAERVEQNENEPNPVLAFELENEVEEATGYLTDVADGKLDGGQDGYYKALNTFYKLMQLRQYGFTPEQYWEMLR